MLAKIGNMDITDYIQESTYKMDESPVENAWKDGEGKNHLDKIRDQITGSFDLVFVRDDLFNAFKANMDANSSKGITNIRVLVTNTNQVKDIKAILRLGTAKRIKISSSYTYLRFNATLEEQ